MVSHKENDRYNPPIPTVPLLEVRNLRRYWLYGMPTASPARTSWGTSTPWEVYSDVYSSRSWWWLQWFSDNTCTIPGSRHYIHADDVASAVLSSLQWHPWTQHGGVVLSSISLPLKNWTIRTAQISRCTRSWINYELLISTLVLGYDLRYTLDDKMKTMDGLPNQAERIAEVTRHWTMVVPIIHRRLRHLERFPSVLEGWFFVCDQYITIEMVRETNPMTL